MTLSCDELDQIVSLRNHIENSYSSGAVNLKIDQKLFPNSGNGKQPREVMPSSEGITAVVILVSCVRSWLMRGLY